MDYIPVGLTYVSTNPLASTLNGSQVIYSVPGSLAPGGTYVYNISFTVDANATGVITNTAEIIADDGDDKDSATDTNPNNDILINDEMNNAGGDEDDHDIEEIVIAAPIDCVVSDRSSR